MKTFFIIILISNFIFAQSGRDTLLFNYDNLTNNFFSRFGKQLNTYNFSSGFLVSKKFNSINLFVDENYSSTIVKIAEKSIKDEQNFRMGFSGDLLDNFSLGLSAINNILSDSRRIEINSASTANVSLFGKYVINQKNYFAPYFGFSINRQVGEKDEGFIYGFEGIIADEKLSDFTINTAARFYNEDISPRKNLLREIRFSAENSIDNYIRNKIIFSFENYKKDFYFAADSITNREFDIVNNIQSRVETNYKIENNFFHSRLFNNTLFNARGAVFFRNVDRGLRYKTLKVNSASILDSRLEEIRFEFESNIAYSTTNFFSMLKIHHYEKDEKFSVSSFPGINEILLTQREELESQKNNKSFRTSISIETSFILSKSDRISISFLQNKFLYDTPNERNFDDRDELLSIAKIRYSRIINPLFEFFISTEGNLNKLVYISAKRSSNNNVNRVLKLTSGGNFSSNNFSSFNSFEVSANYTVFDFEDLNPNLRSFSFRQFSFVDSSTLKINKNVDLKFNGYLKLSEQGDFKWKDFKTRPIRFLEEIYFLTYIQSRYNKLITSIGLRKFSLKTFSYQAANKKIDSYYSSVGPYSSISYFILEKINLSVSGWYDFIEVTNQGRTNQATLYIDLLWNF